MVVQLAGCDIWRTNSRCGCLCYDRDKSVNIYLEQTNKRLLLSFTMHYVGAYSSSLSVSNIVTQPAIMFIVLGLVLVIIGIIGIIGTLRELRIFLWIYIAIVGLILLLEVALIGYLVWNFTQNKEEFNIQVKTAFTPHIEMYREDDDLRALVDLLQEGLECCGINLYSDWENNRLVC